MRYPRGKHVRGSPPKDRAYVTTCGAYIRGGPDEIREIAVGVLSPAYQCCGVPTPRGIRMTLRQALAFAKAIQSKVRQARAWNSAERKKYKKRGK